MSHKYIVDTAGAPRAFGPYSQAVSFGPFLFTSGILPVDKASGQLLRGGIEEQTKLILEHLIAILQSGGLSTKHVVKTTIYLRNRNDLDAVDKVYSRYFDYAAPARTVVEVNRLEQDALVVIEAVAVVPESLESEATHLDHESNHEHEEKKEEERLAGLSTSNVQLSSETTSEYDAALGVPFDQEDFEARVKAIEENISPRENLDKSE